MVVLVGIFDRGESALGSVATTPSHGSVRALRGLLTRRPSLLAGRASLPALGLPSLSPSGCVPVVWAGLCACMRVVWGHAHYSTLCLQHYSTYCMPNTLTDVTHIQYTDYDRAGLPGSSLLLPPAPLRFLADLFCVLASCWLAISLYRAARWEMGCA